MPILKSNVTDARPRINAEAESEKKLFTANVAKGFVELRRGATKGSLLRIKYGEIAELSGLIEEIAGLLDDNQYTTTESLSDDYQPGEAKYVPANPRGPRTPSESGVVSAATQGVGTGEVHQEQELASKPADLEGEAADGTVAQPQPDDSNPFE